MNLALRTLWGAMCSYGAHTLAALPVLLVGTGFVHLLSLKNAFRARLPPTPSATPPAPLAMPFTVREQSYSCKSQWNSICNSSTSTTCNPLYSEGTILELQITMEFHQQLIHQHHLQPHLQCENNSTVANHNGILSTTHARKTFETPFTMRNRSKHDPTTSDHKKWFKIFFLSVDCEVWSVKFGVQRV